jgi:hypothetical protein
MSALSIELIPSLHLANFPGFDTYTGPIGGVLSRSITLGMGATACSQPESF